MKFFQSILFLAIISLFFYCNSKTHHHKKHTLKKKLSKNNLGKQDPAAADAAAADPAAAGGAAGAAAGGNGTNSTKNKVEDVILEENNFAVTKCNEAIKAKGYYIKDLYNYSDTAPMVLIGNVWTLSIFSKDDPSSLVKSIDVAHINKIRKIPGAPGCLEIDAGAENKTLIPCFEKKEFKKGFKKAMKKFHKCRDGNDLQGDDDDEECEKKPEKKDEKKDEAAGGEKKEEGGSGEEGTEV